MPKHVTLEQVCREPLLRELLRPVDAMAPRRFMIGVAGVPGSGKTTLAGKLVAAINSIAPHESFAKCVPMDGFHLTGEELRDRGLEEAKGREDTFDGAGYVSLLQRARQGDSPLPFPVYARSIGAPAEPYWPDRHRPMDKRQILDVDTRVVVTEGNYLLLNDPPWDGIPALLDVSFMLDIDLAEAMQRLIDRRIKFRGDSLAEAEAHYERVDLPNTKVIQAKSSEPDYIIDGPGM